MLALKGFGKFALTISLSLCPVLVSAGPGGTGGGDPTAMEFRNIARNLAQRFTNVGIDVYPKLNLVTEDLRRLADDEQYRFKTKNGPLFLDGSRVVARVNRKKKRLEIGYVDWKSLPDIYTKEQTVIHEFCRFNKIPDDQFQVSWKLMSDLYELEGGAHPAFFVMPISPSLPRPEAAPKKSGDLTCEIFRGVEQEGDVARYPIGLRKTDSPLHLENESVRGSVSVDSVTMHLFIEDKATKISTTHSASVKDFKHLETQLFIPNETRVWVLECSKY